MQRIVLIILTCALVAGTLPRPANSQEVAAKSKAATTTGTAAKQAPPSASGALMSTLSAAMNATPTPTATPTPAPTANPTTAPGGGGNDAVAHELKGQQALKQFCMECHGKGKGPNLVMKRFYPTTIKKTVRTGKGKRMPAFPETKIDDDTLDAIVSYLQDVEARYAPAQQPGTQSNYQGRTRGQARAPRG